MRVCDVCRDELTANHGKAKLSDDDFITFKAELCSPCFRELEELVTEWWGQRSSQRERNNLQPTRTEQA